MSGAMSVESKEILDWAASKLAQQRLPLPAKPETSGSEVSFPVDMSSLKSVELSQWMSQLSGYFGYTTRLLGLVESELVLADAEFKLKVNTFGLDTRERLGGRPAADVVEAAVLKEHDELTSLYRRRLELLTVKTQLDARAKIYERFYQAFSRELSRREMELRLTPS